MHRFMQAVKSPVQDVFDARKDPDQFLNLFTPPLILDEVQFAPELLAALKRKVDESDLMGGYFLIGSQNFSVLKSISESMAGRVALFHLDPFTPLEMTDSGQRTSWISDYLADPIAFMETPGIIFHTEEKSYPIDKETLALSWKSL